MYQTNLTVSTNYYQIIFFPALILRNCDTSRELVSKNATYFFSVFMSSNSDKFRELQRNDATYFCSAFISSNSDTFRELLQNYIYFSELISMDTDISERYYCAIHNFSEFTPNNSDTFWELLANNTTHFFPEFISNSYQTIVHTFFRVHIKQLPSNTTHFFQSLC